MDDHSKPALHRLPLLDGFRLIAALGVMLFHLSGEFDRTELFSRAYLFVDLFFTLSGFVLTLSAEPAMAERRASDFVVKRLRRMWPLVALGSLAGAIAFVPTGQYGQIAWLLTLALAMIPAPWFGLAVFPLNGPQWSLFWELAANALHALVLHRLSDRALLMVALLSGALLAAAIHHTDGCAMGPVADHWLLAAPRVVWSYTVGILLARRFRSRRPTELVDWRLALLLPLGFVLSLAWLPIGRALGDGLAVLIVFPVLFWVLAAAVPSDRAAPLLTALGAVSFPLYALHVPVLVAVDYVAAGVAAHLAGAAAAVGLAAAWAFGVPRLRQGLDTVWKHLNQLSSVRLERSRDTVRPAVRLRSRRTGLQFTSHRNKP